MTDIPRIYWDELPELWKALRTNQKDFAVLIAQRYRGPKVGLSEPSICRAVKTSRLRARKLVPAQVVEWTLSLKVEGDAEAQQQWADYRAWLATRPLPPPVPPGPAAPDEHAGSSDPPSTTPEEAPTASRRPSKRTRNTLLGVGVVVAGTALAATLASWAHGDPELCQRVAVENHRYAHALERLSVAHERLIAQLTPSLSPQARDQIARSIAISENKGPIAGKMGSRLTIPDRPFSWQKKGPCDTAAGEEEINGGCWLGFRDAPCPPKSFEHNGRCYRPIMETPGEPRAEDP